MSSIVTVWEVGDEVRGDEGDEKGKLVVTRAWFVYERERYTEVAMRASGTF